MKKIFLTALSTCMCLLVSAQFSIMSSVNMPEDGEEWSVNNITDNMGAGYQINNSIL